MKKSVRCTTDEVYVVGFVPKYLIPKKRACSLDPFLHPLLTDLEDGFIDGKNGLVNFNKTGRALPKTF